MSANRWSMCPKCRAAQEVKLAKIESQYGKISAQEYRGLIIGIEEEGDSPDQLREDWELGMSEDGTFSVNYSCQCQICGWEYQFKHSQKAKL